MVVDVRVLGKLLGRFFGDSHGGWCFFPEDGLFGCCACLYFSAASQARGLVYGVSFSDSFLHEGIVIPEVPA